MAVGLKYPEQPLPIAGVKLSTVAAGIRYQGRDDLVLIELAEGSRVAAVFTQNKCCAAPVTVAKDNLEQAPTRALLINAGNANAATGELGMQNAQASCAAVAEHLGLAAEQVLPFSTGVIGEQLDMPALLSGVDAAVAPLSENQWLTAAEAIMTTDTLPKAVSKQVEIGGQSISITGIAKGSGMICPDMATLLAYVATDANITQPVLASMLKRATAASFNRITVDSDTSTNDALVLIATGQNDPIIDRFEGFAAETFYLALEALLVDLATAIIRDAEGATKFIKVTVDQAESKADAKSIAYTIAHSPLVKTAIYAGDPNWGRILMALGKSPIDQLDMARVNIRIGDVSLIEKGEPAPCYREELGQAVFAQPEIDITINLGVGDAAYHVWTSDLSHDYVSINADYRS